MKLFLLAICIVASHSFVQANQIYKGNLTFKTSEMSPPEVLIEGPAAKGLYDYLSVTPTRDPGAFNEVWLKRGNSISCRYIVARQEYYCSVDFDSSGIPKF